jgi:FkbM family methyltransferase
MRRKGGLGWLPTGPAETEESRFWAAQDFSGKVVYDVGAFHGLLTLYFARSARRVISYEPDPINRARLLRNLSLNRTENVTVRPVGLGDSIGQARMHHEDLMPGGSRIGAPDGETVVSLQTLDAEIASGSPPPDFVKIDVEGFEIPVLQGALTVLREYQPDVFVEIHGYTEAEKVANAEGVIRLLREAGYSHLTHLESAQPATPQNAKRGHVIARSTAARPSPGR